MAKKKKIEPPLKLDMTFEQALKKALNTPPVKGLPFSFLPPVFFKINPI